jgi:hypothetical protein
VPVYVRRSADEPTLLYGGSLEIEISDGVHVCYGEVELTEGASGPLVVHVVGNEGWMASGAFDEAPPIVRLPVDASLQPPESSALPSRPEQGSWVDWPIHVNTLEHGDVGSASRFLIHIAGDLGRCAQQFGRHDDKEVNVM